MLSFIAKSNLFTKAVAAKTDPRQEVPDSYKIPNAETRLLLARLIFEEAKETIYALGCFIHSDNGTTEVLDNNVETLDIDDIIDGCCDTIYVATGALCAVGAPDEPHMKEVCVANNRKFPGGVAVINPDTGKYLKPEGWKGPDHAGIRSDCDYPQRFNMRTEGKILLTEQEGK